MPTKYGDFTAYGFVNKLNGEHHVALVKGEIGQGEKIDAPCVSALFADKTGRVRSHPFEAVRAP